MTRTLKSRFPILVTIAALGLFWIGCSGSHGASAVRLQPVPAPAAPAPAPTAAPAPAAVPAPPAAAAPAPAAMVPTSLQVMKEAADSDADVFSLPDLQQIQARAVSQRRIIVRTVDMDLIVRDIQGGIDSISDLAEEFHGWVVSSDASNRHEGSISIRVPADQLEAAILGLRELATDVQSEVTSSVDVTDEYVDLQSRLQNQLATEGALLKLFEQAESVEHALEVQRELTRVQEVIEQIRGRIKLLEETAAFSLINVRLQLASAEMEVDAGPDRTVAAGAPVKLRATFRPPVEAHQFEIVWDFGDGSPTDTIHRTAPTTERGEMVTATVSHAYSVTEFSPYIVTVEIRAAGPLQIGEGSDTMIVSVTEIPAIQVFGGEDLTVDQNEEVHFSGSFTRPSELINVKYTWEFGDGSVPVEGALPAGVTRAEAVHSYSDHRPGPYSAKLIVTADSEVGEVRAEDEVSVWVKEDLGLVVAGFELGGNVKTAVRAMTGFAQWLTVAGIWLAIFSPFWGAVVALVWYLRRQRSRRRAELPDHTESPVAQEDGDDDSAEGDDRA